MLYCTSNVFFKKITRNLHSLVFCPGPLLTRCKSDYLGRMYGTLLSLMKGRIVLKAGIVIYNDSMTNMLRYYQLRVTAAEPGRVDFELDIQKEHTVRLSSRPLPEPLLTMDRID